MERDERGVDDEDVSKAFEPPSQVVLSNVEIPNGVIKISRRTATNAGENHLWMFQCACVFTQFVGGRPL